MPQGKKRNTKAYNAAKASIKLRNSAQGQTSRILKAVANKLADAQLAKAMKINKETREISRKSRKK